ncbi:sensor histidine kinase [Oceanobacillus polygoni]|uniref:histidine kinase n=1 Tax=Oceanobacillus polygoni TaxID=1235259 RepID=A0A9X1CDM2_9BACI|nr:HAMP domain-containing sensor histidine kinase [Oceanobacillus polygoni]MBP2079929.1 histidine kinase [Oceanobacillus polygoni]
MTIKKRLILSNIMMIALPICAFFLIEIVLATILLYRNVGENWTELFITLRFVGMVIVLIVTNGLLTYVVAKSIIKPINKLSEAAKEISNGNLDNMIEVKGKDEVSRLAETFERMREQLKKSQEIQAQYDEDRRELIASISHDLKTPMTSIKGYITGIRDGVANTPEKVDRYMEIIQEKTNDMNYLIDALFLYSKLDLQQVPFHYEALDLQAFLADFVDEFRYEFVQGDEQLTYMVEQDQDYMIRADREQLKRVIMNIVQNSVKYMDKSQKQLSIQLKSEDEQVIVEIKDNGSGISEEAIDHIFDRFYRADASRNTATGGSGLGLAIVKRIVKEHGGKIWAKSKLGEGTTVCVALPKERGNGLADYINH